MIELRGITKEYRNWLRPWAEPMKALQGVDLDVAPGEALGIVGLNGAGKSTLLRILLGYVHPTSGTAKIGGLAPRDYVVKHGIGYVPERVAIKPSWTVVDAMRTYAMLSDTGDDAWKRVDESLDRLGLDHLAGLPVGKLSKGNLQRLAIAQAILTDRSIMVLDEPTDGLDPVWIAGLRDIIDEWRQGDSQRILLMTSHNLPEIQRLTDRKILLHNGRIARELPADSAEDLESSFHALVGSLEEART